MGACESFFIIGETQVSTDPRKFDHAAVHNALLVEAEAIGQNGDVGNHRECCPCSPRVLGGNFVADAVAGTTFPDLRGASPQEVAERLRLYIWGEIVSNWASQPS